MSQPSRPPEERRSHPRYPTSMEVDYEAGDDHFLFAYVENISEMGIFLRTEEPLPVGTELTVRFRQQGEPLTLRGRVMWVNPARRDGSDLNPGMGIRFEQLSGEAREQLVEMVKTIAYLPDDPAQANE